MLPSIDEKLGEEEGSSREKNGNVASPLRGETWSNRYVA